jgi:hypothetical protein
MIGVTKSEALTIGGEPRVDLLPPEVRAQRNAAALRRRLGFGVILLLALAVGGSGAAGILAIQAQVSLATEQARTASILVQQRKYIQVRSVQDEVSLIQAAQQVGTSTEIDWRKYLAEVQATLPANVTLDTVTIDSASPLTAYVQATAPLQGSRVATLSFTAKSPTLPEVPAWLDALATLPGYTDASPGSVTRDDTSGIYTVNITMHINQAAYTNRFAAKGK